MNVLTELIFVQSKARRARSRSYEGEYGTMSWVKRTRQKG